ncbi:MAG: hypothetical protein H6867_09405 [Rhodospirillales bacterium]|nr:hypothetical protein [Rhodospirillales bacterium]
MKTVIWEVYSSFGGDDPDVMHDQSPLPLFIYNDSLLDDWRYVFNNDVVEEALKAAIGKKKKRKPLEQLYLWKNEEQFQRFNSPENVRAMKDAVRESKQNGHIPLTMSPPQDHYDFPSVEQNLMPLLEDYPDVAFTIYYPPISYYAYAAGGNDLFWQRMKLQEYVLDHTADMDNVTIYAFDLGEDFGENLANFMDPSHYSPSLTSASRNLSSPGRAVSCTVTRTPTAGRWQNESTCLPKVSQNKLTTPGCRLI